MKDWFEESLKQSEQIGTMKACIGILIERLREADYAEGSVEFVIKCLKDKGIDV